MKRRCVRALGPWHRLLLWCTAFARIALHVLVGCNSEAAARESTRVPLFHVQVILPDDAHARRRGRRGSTRLLLV
jgi:hypothetical protein